MEAFSKAREVCVVTLVVKASCLIDHIGRYNQQGRQMRGEDGL